MALRQQGDLGGPSIPPFGVGHFKWLPNSLGEAEDCIFLDINPTFEMLTGLCVADVIGRRASEVFCGLAEDVALWNAFY